MAEVYDDSPALAQLPLSADDVDRLLRSDGRYFTRDAGRVRHLLSRMAATLAVHTRTVRQLHGDVDRLMAASKSGSAPLATAVEALGKLSVDEQRQVLNVFASGLVDGLRAATADARRVKLAAVSDANRVRLVLAQVSDDPELTDDVRARVRHHLAGLPASSTLPVDLPVVDIDRAVPAGSGGFTVPPATPDATTATGRGPGARPVDPPGPSTHDLGDLFR